MSAYATPAARTFTRTTPAAGEGKPSLTSLRTSGPPKRVITMRMFFWAVIRGKPCARCKQTIKAHSIRCRNSFESYLGSHRVGVKLESADYTSEWRRSRSVQALRHPAGEIRLAASTHGSAHRFRHQNSIGGLGYRCIHQHAIGAEFHRNCGVRRCADTRVHDHRNFRDSLAKNPQISGILDAETRANRCRQRHYRRSADIDQLPGGDKVVVAIRQNDKTLFHKNLGRFDELPRVGEQCLLIADNLEFDPIREADFAGEPGCPDSFVSGIASGGVRKDEYLLAINIIEQRFFRLVRQIDAANGHRHHVRAGCDVRAGHLLKAAVLPGSNDKT